MDAHETNFAERLVAQMTTEEKAALCSGETCWDLKAISRLGLETITVMDGPHGLRKQVGTADNLGIGRSEPAVCFPTASALACGFDRSLIFRVGEALGNECVQEGVSVLLGPGVNMKRSPLCGRNFEYFSEDPLLAGELAAAMISGIQSTGTGASLKHFAVNNQEKRRMTISAVLDERTLRETYLRAFEIAVKKGRPDTVMCAYNKLNGVYCSENKRLLTDILRKEWGFEGLVVSDWGAVHNRAQGVSAGLDLEMPGNHGYNDKKILEAVKDGTLLVADLDRAALHVTRLILKGLREKKNRRPYDAKVHHSLAVEASEQTAVLLKNVGALLPAKSGQRAAVIGAFAKTPRYQAAGSSLVTPIRIENAWDVFVEYGEAVSYAQGYALKAENDQKEGQALLRQAVETAKDKDIVYLFVGLPDGYETEGMDRQSLKLPESHNRLVEAVTRVNPNVVVILSGGAPMALPWIDAVSAVLLSYLGGEGSGRACVNLLLGKAVPSGKLAETWPLSLEDTPANHYFPGGRSTVEYRESIYIGYRYYEKAGKPVLFPFGHGLSYAAFAYSDLKIDKAACAFGDEVTVSFCITNSGCVRASEAALVFTAHENETVFLPVKELRDFVKVTLDPGQTREMRLTLDTKAFGYYNTLIGDWYAESGTYRILVGPSSDSARCLMAALELHAPVRPQPDFRKTAPVYYHLPAGGFIVPDAQFESLVGGPLPPSSAGAGRPYLPENTLEDLSGTFAAKALMKYADSVIEKAADVEKAQMAMMKASVREMPLFALVSSEQLSEKAMESLLYLINGHFFKAIGRLLKK